jgi:ElaA protein
MKWVFHRFASFDTHTLFAVMKLRVDVFVVEQACAYPELDSCDNDAGTLHLLGYDGSELTAYARAMPDSRQRRVRIGRVVVAPASRGQGQATELMRRLMSRLEADYPGFELQLAAQQSVVDFYTSLGFSAVSDVYLEEGIAHVDMLRASACTSSSRATDTSTP